MEKNARNVLVALAILTLCTTMLISSLYLVTNNRIRVNHLHIITKVYLGRFTEREYLPLLILYDPYGDESYRKNLITTNASFALQMEGTSQIEVNGSIKTGIQGISYSSSNSNNTSKIEPGKGDTVAGDVYDLTWDAYKYHDFDPYTNVAREYLHLDLVSSAYYGGFAMLRETLAAMTNTRVENKTGQTGAYTYRNVIGFGCLEESYFNYTWSGTIQTGFSFNVTISIANQPVTVVPVSYSIFCSTPQSIPCVAHYYDSSHTIDFYVVADSANFSLSLVYSYALWYNPG